MGDNKGRGDSMTKEKPKEKPKEKSKANHYIDNALFYEKMSDWKKILIEAEEDGGTKPPITEYIGGCFLKIAEHLSYKPNFINYPYRDEMVGDGIENCIMYAHNFNPEKSKNPFSYFTQIVYYAFLRRIEKEKKQSYIKFKAIEMAADSTLSSWFRENYFDKSRKDLHSMIAGSFDVSEKDIDKFTPKKKKKNKNSKNSLEEHLEDDKSEDSPIK